MPAQAYLNRVATAVPPNDVHQFFLGFASSQLSHDPRRRAVFNRMADKGGIEHRYSCFEPASDPEGGSADVAGIFARGDFPGTAKRMDMFAATAPELARQAVEKVLEGEDRSRITHMIVTTCTGFSAPGLDLEVIALLWSVDLHRAHDHRLHGLLRRHQRPQAARHIVRSEPEARVLIVNIELCTLHLKETTDLEKLLSFCLWGDGCAASIVSAERRVSPGQLPGHRCGRQPGTDDLERA